MDGDFDGDRSQLFIEVESYAVFKIFWFDWEPYLGGRGGGERDCGVVIGLFCWS